MPAMKSKPTNNPWAAIDALIKTEPEPMGPEWFTLEDFAVRYHLTYSMARRQLDSLLLLGKVKRWKGLGGASRRITKKFCAV